MFPLSAKTIRLLIASSLYAFCLVVQAQSENVVPKLPMMTSDLKAAPASGRFTNERDYLKETSRGARYCVVNILEYGFFGAEIHTYSSRKFSGCNEDAYHQLTEASIAAQMRTSFNVRQVIKGGFHNIVASRDLNPFTTPYIFLGEIRLQRHVILNVNYLSYVYKYITDSKFRRGLANSSYVPLSGNSPMQYLYNPGEQVHELVSPDGRVFTMTSYTDYLNSSLTLENLKDMGSLLNLPTGWQYRTRTIDKQIIVKTSAPAYEFVGLFDEFSNYYVQTK